MDKPVQYTITLKDLLSNALTQAEKKAKSLEETLGGLGKTAIAAFGAYEAYNFVKDSVAAFDEAAQASAMLDNQLQNSGRTSVQFREALQGLSEDLMEKSRFDDDAIASGQAVLAGFKNLSDELVLRATPALVDAATAMGTDVKSAAQAVGMALESPADATRKLRSMNILLNDEQKKTIENLVKSGDKAKAQAVVLDLIANKYKGAGEAAATTGQGALVVLQNQLGNVREAFGGVVVELLSAFMPVFKAVGEVFKAITSFMTEHTSVIKGIAIALGIGGAAFVLYTGYVKGAALYTKLMAMEQWSLNAAFAANPIGIVIAGLVALGAAVGYAWENFEGFRKFVYGVFEVIKNAGDIVGNYLSGLKDKIVGTITMDDAQIARGAASMQKAGQLLGEAWNKGQSKGAASFAASNTPSGLVPTAAPTASATGGGGGGAVSAPKGSPTTKATTITITIDKLVESLSVNTTNIQESTSKIRELVATALTDALNDSQIIAGG